MPRKSKYGLKLFLFSPCPLHVGANFYRTQRTTTRILWYSDKGIEFETYSQTASINIQRSPPSYVPNAHVQNVKWYLFYRENVWWTLFWAFSLVCVHQGQAHHMFSRLLNLRITNFSFDLLVTSKNETTNSPIYKFTNLKCCKMSLKWKSKTWNVF